MHSDSVEVLRLTPAEWAILAILLQHPGQLVTSAELLDTVWGPGVQLAHQLPAIPRGQAAPQARR